MGTLPCAGLRRPARLARLCLAGFLLAGVVTTGYSASNVRVQADGKTITLASTGDTVRAALADAKVAVDPDDEVSPPLDAPVPADGLVRVSRVTFAESTLEEKIPYRTLVRPATRGQRPFHPTVVKEGQAGLKRVVYRARVVDGREVERTTVREEVLREPVHQIVVSRNPLVLGSRGAYTGKRTLEVVATAYDPGPGSCGKYANGQTCNGKRAGYGVIAVDPKVIPLGAKLFVPGYGYGIAADVGGAIKGNRVDLGFNSRAGSFQWGKRRVTLTIVE